MTEFEDMPDEVIINIFTYLRLIDRKNTRLVCKRWHELSYSTILIQNDVTVVDNYLSLDEVISPNTRHINVRTKMDYKVINLLLNLRPLQFWLHYGEGIKSVEISRVDVDDEFLLDVFENCPNLQHLSLSHNTTKFATSSFCNPVNFPKLLSLELNYLSDLNPEAFRRLTKNAPLLKKISLEGWPNKIEGRAILEILRETVNRQYDQLKEVNLSYSFIRDEDVQEIAEVVGPQLSGFYIKNCFYLTNRCAPYIAKHMINLEKLYVDECRFSGASFRKLFVNLTKLTHVSLKKCEHVTDRTIIVLKILPHLTSLDLTDCTKISGMGLTLALGDQIRLKMMDLRLENLENITNDAIISIVPNLPNLRVLYLTGCSLLTDESLKVILSHNRLLRHLFLERCPRIHIDPSLNALKGLIELNLMGCFITGESIRRLELRELQILHLHSVHLEIDDINSMLSGCPSIQCIYGDHLFLWTVFSPIFRHRDG